MAGGSRNPLALSFFFGQTAGARAREPSLTAAAAAHTRDGQQHGAAAATRRRPAGGLADAREGGATRFRLRAHGSAKGERDRDETSGRGTVLQRTMLSGTAPGCEAAGYGTRGDGTGCANATAPRWTR